ncbi:MAG: GDP-mannose 4,6-dehydratase [Oscillospiraceae bacterium]
MKTALMIGGAGFVGAYLAEAIEQAGLARPVVTKLAGETLRIPCECHDLDILDEDAVKTLLCAVKPDYIFHLAAQSSVSLSWKKPAMTADVNIRGTIHVLEAVRECCPQARLLLIGSGEEYGVPMQAGVPLREDNPVRPENCYAVTKVAQELFGAVYTKAYGLDIVTVRAFNHIGPNQTAAFVTADFASRIAQIEAGLAEARLTVGNLDAVRDFTDVRDIVRAYVRLAQAGKSGEIYNVGSGRGVAVRELLETFLTMTVQNIEVVTDPEKLRALDVPFLVADTEKITRDTGWTAEIPLAATLRDTLDFWRRQYAAQP